MPKPNLLAKYRPVPLTANAARAIAGLTFAGMAVALALLVAGGMVLIESRRDVWRQAVQSSDNLALALEHDVTRRIAQFDRSLLGVAAIMQMPGIDQVSPEIRRAALFDYSTDIESVGSLVVLDRDGVVLTDSLSELPKGLNLADRDFFIAQRDRPDIGLFVSRPFVSRVPGGGQRVSLSRRISKPDGSFAGVVEVGIRLSYFRSRFELFNMGLNGAVSLVRTDGQMLVRIPFREGDLDVNVTHSDVFRHITAAPAGQYVGISPFDGAERLNTFRQVGDLPLIVTVAVSLDEVFAGWWRRALAVSAMMGGLCAATVMLCLLFRRELLRRLSTEGDLQMLAERLEVTASIDELTGLANRRAFNAAFRKEWLRATRSQLPIGLLILDADRFKQFNDRYGHPEGDRALHAIAGAVQQNILRPGDLAARYGGEEFAVLLPETELAGALTIAELIRGAVQALAIPHVDAPTGWASISIGVAVAYPQAALSESVLLKAADTALYDAKAAGRNRVACAPLGISPVLVPVAVPGLGSDTSGIGR